MNIRKFVIGIVVATVSTLGVVSSAFAEDAGVHLKVDAKVKTVEKLDLRFTPEFVFAERAGGLRQSYARLGPSYHLLNELTVGVNGYDSLTLGNKAQDVKVEPQVDLSPRLWDFTMNDRNRLGYRPLDAATGDRWQYANELKLNYEPVGSTWVPFVSDEVFIQSQSKNQFYQNRVIAGLGFKWATNRVDTGYMLRSDRNVATGWDNSHFLYVSLTTNR